MMPRILMFSAGLRSTPSKLILKFDVFFYCCRRSEHRHVRFRWIQLHAIGSEPFEQSRQIALHLGSLRPARPASVGLALRWIIESSAYVVILQLYLRWLVMSLVKMLNIIGPRILPCTTPNWRLRALSFPLTDCCLRCNMVV